MIYRSTQEESRNRYLATYDDTEAAKYDSWIASMTDADHDACVADLKGCVTFSQNMTVLDAESFDLIASRLLANCLFDPLAAFRNWQWWLRPGGKIVVMDGLFDRDAWTGRWDGMVDSLPLSACRTLATVPYLLEQSGFQIDHVGFMESTNALPSTRTKRYMVVATKPLIENGKHARFPSRTT